MAATDTRLTLMVFPQRIDDGSLRLRLLAAPTTDPLSSPAAGVGPFADTRSQSTSASFVGLRICLSRGEESPRLLRPSRSREGSIDLRGLRRALSRAPVIPQRRPSRGCASSKSPSPGYLAAAGASRLNSPDLIPADDYACAVHAMLDPDSRPPRPPASDDLSWNQVFARSLRQPLLAEALGIVRPITLELAQDEILAEGGYIVGRAWERLGWPRRGGCHTDWFVCMPRDCRAWR